MKAIISLDNHYIEESWFLFSHPHNSPWATSRERFPGGVSQKIGSEKYLISIFWSINDIHTLTKFHARLDVRGLTIQVGKFRRDIAKFETCEMQEFDDVMLVAVHRSGAFQFSTIFIAVLRAVSSRENSKFSCNPSISRGD
jgi:hypothetical protein